MGMSAGGKKSGRGGRRGRYSSGGVMSEINVTPMVDVMLVLLIIFMVAAPLMTVGVPIDLPDTQAKSMNTDTQPITVSVNATGEIFIQETPITIEEIVPKLQAIWKDQLAQAGGESPAEFAKRIRAEIEKWQKVVATAGIKLD